MTSQWFGLAQVLYILACGVLLLGSIRSAILVGHAGKGFIALALAIGLLLQTVALVSWGVGAQLTRGAYWIWDPIACWGFVAWLSTAISAVGVCRMGWRGRRAQVTFIAATAVVLFVLLGSRPLVRWLGLGSLYLGG